jgi:cyclohexanone monooxygenase
MAANIPGKKREMLAYPGGLPAYSQKSRESFDAGYVGFTPELTHNVSQT